MTIIERILPNDEAAAKITSLLSIPTINTVRGWKRRKSIPKEFWLGLHENGIATLEELALAAASKQNKETANVS
jgi:hypothetical protein